MIIISGCPRSGTSMMTLTIKEMLSGCGYSVIGEKFPSEIEYLDPNQTEKQKALKKYLFEIGGKESLTQMEQRKLERKKEREETRKMNPHGFWEGRYSVRGCNWHLGIEKIIEGKKICKIVSQGLMNTNPKFIDKIIFMVRHPNEVAKSQEDLKHDKVTHDIINSDKNMRVHSPHMFINVSTQASRYFEDTGIIPLIVDYYEYTTNPEKELDRIIEYLGEGDKQKGLACLDLKCKRSKGENTAADEQFIVANKIFKMLKSGEWKNIIEYSEGLQNQNMEVPCVRAKITMSISHCKECMKCGDFTKSLIQDAENKSVSWKSLPCVYECGIDPKLKAGDNFLTIEESKGEKNHWKKCQI